MKKKQSSLPTIIMVIIIGIVAFGGTVLALKYFGNRSPVELQGDTRSGSNTSDANSFESTEIPDGAIGSSTDLIGGSVDLIPSARSIRSLEGLLVQVNQIDTCQAPKIDVYANLTNEDGKPVSNVRKEDFTVAEDGRAVNDFVFAELRQQEVPLAITLVIDISGSMKGDPIVKAREAAVDYVNRLQPNDQVALVVFDDVVETRLPATSNKQQVVDAINQIQTRGNTALYDAVAAGAQQTPNCGRSAVVVLSDGEDTASKTYDLAKAINAANLKNVPTYVIGLTSAQFNPAVLKQIAESTGAQYFEAPQPQNLVNVYTAINDQLRGQFRFSYTTQNATGDHRVQVKSDVDGADTQSEKSYRR